MRTLLYIAMRNLVQARTRSLLLSTAIGLVTGMLVLLLSISVGEQLRLQDLGGNRTQAAEMLGIGLRTLQRKLKEYRMAGKTEGS